MRLIITLLSTLLSLSYAIPSQAQKQQTEQEFEQTYSLIQSRHFEIEFDAAYPPGWEDKDLSDYPGTIVINDSIAKGNLPYFGNGDITPDPENVNIVFDNKMQQATVNIKNTKKNILILYKFNVAHQNELFQVNMEIGSNGKCTATISSGERSQITYSGFISPIKEQKEKSQKN